MNGWRHDPTQIALLTYDLAQIAMLTKCFKRISISLEMPRILNYTFEDTIHSRRPNSFLQHRFVERKRCILRQNDKYIICRKTFGLSKYIKRGGKKGGRAFWMAINNRCGLEKVENITFIVLGACIWKGGATFRNIGSDHIHHDTKLW